MQALLAALQGRVAQLEVVWRERDELAIQLRQIEAYQPGVTAKARAWVEQIDSTPRR